MKSGPAYTRFSGVGALDRSARRNYFSRTMQTSSFRGTWWRGLAVVVALAAGGSLRAERAVANISFLMRAEAASRGPIVNFTLEGASSKSVLVRAVGPTLGSFGLPSVLGDPKLTVYNASGTAVATNSGWGGSTAVAGAMAAVGAFNLGAGSKDAALLVLQCLEVLRPLTPLEVGIAAQCAESGARCIDQHPIDLACKPLETGIALAAHDFGLNIAQTRPGHPSAKTMQPLGRDVECVQSTFGAHHCA